MLDYFRADDEETWNNTDLFLQNDTEKTIDGTYEKLWRFLENRNWKDISD